MKKTGFLPGCEALLASPPPWLRSARLGLLSNQASVSRSLRHVKDLLSEAGARLTLLFSPQHGFHSEKQANMIESDDSRDPELGVPIVSLYAQSRQPSAEALDKIDILLIDLQDVGTRVYTYTTTLGLCMEAAARAGVKVVVLDRPNPIGGREVEGNVLEPEFRSFVGRYPVPMRHGLTMGEYALFIEAGRKLGCDVEVIRMRGWRRSSLFDALGFQWAFPSPNVPTWDTSLFYPGMVLFEGTNVSEGRGTTMPFKLFGAPWLDRDRLRRLLVAAGLPGVLFRPVVFEPAFDKFKGEPCRGFQIHIEDPVSFKPYRTGLTLLQALCRVHPEQFRWLDPPYEYEWEKLPIDILTGSGELRRRLESGEDLESLEAQWAPGLEDYRSGREAVLLYPE